MLAFSDKNMRIELVRLGSLFPRSVSEDSAVAVGPYRFRPGVRQYIVIDECGGQVAERNKKEPGA